MKNPDSDRPSLDEWDDLFRQRFADFQSEPPADALQRILADLTASTPAPPPQSTGWRSRWWLGGAVFLLLLTGTVWVTQYESTKEELTQIKAQTLQQDVVTAQSMVQIPTVQTDQPNKQATPEQTLTQKEPSVDDRTLTPKPLASTSEKAADFVKSVSPASGREVARVVGVRSEEVTSPFVSPVMELARTSRQVQKQEPSRTGKQRDRTEPIVLAASPAVPPMEQRTSTQPIGNPIGQISGNTPVDLLSGEQTGSMMEFTLLNNHPTQSLRVRLNLPDVAIVALPPVMIPKTPTVKRQRPVLYGSVMPLYTYQRINPVQDDAVWVKSVTTQKTLSTQRAGVRLQAGVEWPLGRRMALRTSLAYNQLTQQLTYALPSTQPDSVVVERINAQTIRLTPYYNDQRVSTRTNWHYVGIGTELVWQLGKLGGWQHYLTTGASAGTYLNGKSFMPNGPLSGFVQGSYGLERPITRTLWLRVAPTVQYGLSTVSDETGLFHVRPYTYGLTIGLRR